MLSGSGLRTFAITASSRIPCAGCSNYAGMAPAPRLPSTWDAGGLYSLTAIVLVIRGLSQGRRSQPIKLAWKANCLLGKHPAGNGWLEGGRSSLLESAQEATLSSVATWLSCVNAMGWAYRIAK